MNGELAQVLDLGAYRRRRAGYVEVRRTDESLYYSIWFPPTWAEPRTQEAQGFKWADHLWKKEIK